MEKRIDTLRTQLAGADSGDGPDDEGDDDGGKCCSLGVQISENDIQLPDGVDPMDVGQILVSDSSGNVLLIGYHLGWDTSVSVQRAASSVR